MHNITFGSLNLCLGLPNKRDTVVEILKSNNVGVCCLQEVEVQMNFPEKLLNCGGFNLELELNTYKKRAGIYVKQDINYTRRSDLEKEDFHIVIVDVILNVKIRIINVYRTFRPSNGMNPIQFFVEQLHIIRNALCANCYVMGDFNLDAKMNHRLEYYCSNDKRTRINILNLKKIVTGCLRMIKSIIFACR